MLDAQTVFELKEIKPQAAKFAIGIFDEAEQQNIKITLTEDRAVITCKQKNDHLFFRVLARNCSKNSIELGLRSSEKRIVLQFKIHDLVKVKPLLSSTKKDLALFYNRQYSQLLEEITALFDKTFKMLRNGPIKLEQPIAITPSIRERLLAIINNADQPLLEHLSSFFNKKSRYKETVRSLKQQINDPFMTVQDLQQSVQEIIEKFSRDGYESLFDVLSKLNNELWALILGFADEETFQRLCTQKESEILTLNPF